MAGEPPPVEAEPSVPEPVFTQPATAVYAALETRCPVRLSSATNMPGPVFVSV